MVQRAGDPEIVGASLLRPAVLLAAAVGGVVGALARWAAGLVWPTGAAAFPVTTLAVNVSGCLAVGLVAGVLDAQPRTPRLVLLRPFAVTGVLGGYTTFSTWSLDVDWLLRGGRPVTAATDVAVTLVGAVLAVAAGVLLARRLTGPASPVPTDPPSVRRTGPAGP